MSRKDYVAIADVLRLKYEEGDASVKSTVEAIARGLCNLFAADNASFDRQRFLKAVHGE